MATSKNIMANATNWKEKFNEIVSPLIGHPLNAGNIHNDNPGYYYYIRQLKPGNPIILNHYRGPLFVVLPEKDYVSLEKGELSVEYYIQNSHFYFGYFWGGGALTGAYWQPFEDVSGIHETDKISRYLTILSCRTSKHSSGYSPSERSCKACKLDSTSCPFSPLNKTGSWDKEVQEKDVRINFMEQVRKILIDKGFDRISILSHTDSNNLIKLYKVGDFLQAQIPQWILNDMLYYPKKDWSNILDSLKFSDLIIK